MKCALLLAGVLVAGPVDASDSSWLLQQTANMHRFVGPFVDNDYGFSIKAPPGAAGYVTNGGDANHGAVFILGEGRSIVAYAEYVGFTAGDANPCRRKQFSWEPASTRISAVGSLGGHRVCTVSFAQGNKRWRVIQATRSDRGSNRMYTLLLTTTAQWSNGDFFSLQQSANSFQLIPIVP